MKCIVVNGGKKLMGDVAISGAKNSALPILAASLLVERGVSQISNMPDLLDIDCMLALLASVEVSATISQYPDIYAHSSNRMVEIDASVIGKPEAKDSIVNKMRASILVLAPLLVRKGEAHVALPGGCAIGQRPIDLHIEVLQAMGAEVKVSDKYVNAKLVKDQRLKGAVIKFKKVTVGATETAIMAAVLAEGETIIQNAAHEPEIVDLCNYLNSCGAKISGFGTSEITIQGVLALHGAAHTLIGDRIEAGTYAVAAAITKGDMTLRGIEIEYIDNALSLLKQMGVAVEVIDTMTVRVHYNGPLRAVDIVTNPYPEFPTDLQAQFLALSAISAGECSVAETIFENRFMHVEELCKMGADIEIINDNRAQVRGVVSLHPALLRATDLRAAAALILAALSCKGTSVVTEVEYLFRGYSNVLAKFQALGADISLQMVDSRLRGNDPISYVTPA